MIRNLLGVAAIAAATSMAGCGHSYAAPVVVTVHTAPDAEADVAWVVEDGGRIVRCVNGPDRPMCRRANVE